MKVTSKDFPAYVSLTEEAPDIGGIGIGVSFENLSHTLKDHPNTNIPEGDVLSQLVIEKDGIIFVFKPQEEK